MDARLVRLASPSWGGLWSKTVDFQMLYKKTLNLNVFLLVFQWFSLVSSGFGAKSLFLHWFYKENLDLGGQKVAQTLRMQCFW